MEPRSGGTATGDEQRNDPEVLTAVRLAKRYRGESASALADFSVCLHRGEFYGLLGANGAGKTTAMSVLSGLLTRDSGELSVMGIDPCRDREQCKTVIGVVPQHVALYEPLSGRENLQFFGRLHGLGGRDLHRRVEECLEFAGLSECGGRPVSGYSGGMKRRLNLAAGVVGQPRILFLDEPTVGIDIQSRHLIYRKLRELQQSGTAIFYTTHYLKEAEELCDRVGIIDHGRLVAQGPPGKLIADIKVADLEALLLHVAGAQPSDH